MYMILCIIMKTTFDTLKTHLKHTKNQEIIIITKVIMHKLIIKLKNIFYSSFNMKIKLFRFGIIIIIVLTRALCISKPRVPIGTF